jgi:hypothetical protein
MTDQIHLLRQILEKTREYISTLNIFVDFKAAYNSERRCRLYKAMEELHIPLKLVTLTKTTRKVKCKVMIHTNHLHFRQTMV